MVEPDNSKPKDVHMTPLALHHCIALSLLLPCLVQASPNADTVRVNANATAATRDDAIATALTQAVIRVQGKDLPADELSRIFLTSLREDRLMRMTARANERIRSTRISTAIAFVQDYQVVGSTRDEDSGRWEARISADVVSPEARLAQLQGALSLTLLPFVFMKEEEGEVGGIAAQAALRQTQEDIAGFRHQLAGLLRFGTRLDLHALPPEKDSDYATAADTPGQVNWPALAQLTGARHFITVQVEDFRLEAVRLRGNITTARLDGGYTLHYRLIRTDERQTEVVKSGTFTVDTRHPQLRPLAFTESKAQVTPETVHHRRAAVHARVAQLFAKTLLGELILSHVVAREGESIRIQPGAKSLQVGDHMAVLGPSTSEADNSLGLLTREDGMRVAVIEITSSDAAEAQARVIKGNAYAVLPGSLLRHIGNVSAATVPTPPPLAGQPLTADRQ